MLWSVLMYVMVYTSVRHKGGHERQHSVTPEIQAYRYEALRQVWKANISLSSFGDLST